MQKEFNEQYYDKLLKSYEICLNELKNPSTKWEEEICKTKYTIDHETKQPLSSHIFILNHLDDIHVPNSKHTYIFKRSHFYNKFKIKNSRIRRDLISYYNPKGYYVSLYKEDRWCLKLSWKHNEIKGPNIKPLWNYI